MNWENYRQRVYIRQLGARKFLIAKLDWIKDGAGTRA